MKYSYFTRMFNIVQLFTGKDACSQVSDDGICQR